MENAKISQKMEKLKIKSAREFWKEKFDEEPQNDAEKLAVVMMGEFAFYWEQAVMASSLHGLLSLAYESGELNIDTNGNRIDEKGVENFINQTKRPILNYRNENEKFKSEKSL